MLKHHESICSPQVSFKACPCTTKHAKTNVCSTACSRITKCTSVTVGGRVFFKGLAKRFFFKGLAEPSVEFELQQAIGEGLFAGSSFAASYCGRTIRGVFFCSKLLGKDYPQGLLLQQAIGEGLSAGSSFAASVFFCSKLLGKDHPQGLLLQQAIGKGPFVGLFSQQAIGQIKFVISFCGVFFCSKLLGMS